MKITMTSLFAGIGGFDLAAQRVGITPTVTVEVDNACRGVLRYHWPEATHLTDIKDVSADDITAAGFDPEHGVITGGWPCTDLSRGGARAGDGTSLRNPLCPLLGTPPPCWRPPTGLAGGRERPRRPHESCWTRLGRRCQRVGRPRVWRCLASAGRCALRSRPATTSRHRRCSTWWRCRTRPSSANGCFGPRSHRRQQRASSSERSARAAGCPRAWTKQCEHC